MIFKNKIGAETYRQNFTYPECTQAAMKLRKYVLDKIQKNSLE